MDLGFEGGFEVPPRSLDPSSRHDPNSRPLAAHTNFRTVFACDVAKSAKVAWEHFFDAEGPTGRFHLESIVDIVKGLEVGHDPCGLLPAPGRRGIDVVTGGFPCNDFSVSGKRLGFASTKSHRGNKSLLGGDEDPTIENRGMLYFWMREFVSLVRPAVFYAENVKGLVSLGDAQEVIARDFASVGYFVYPVRVLRAVEFGVPQTRERVIFIGVEKSRVLPEALEMLMSSPDLVPADLDLYPAPTHTAEQVVTVAEALAGLPEPDDSDDLSQRSFSQAKYMGRGLQGQAEARDDAPGPTIRAEHHGNIEFRRLSRARGGSNAGPERRLSVRECARIQTFPDRFEFVLPRGSGLSASDGYRAIGNAVPPLLAWRLARRLEEVWPRLFGD